MNMECTYCGGTGRDRRIVGGPSCHLCGGTGASSGNSRETILREVTTAIEVLAQAIAVRVCHGDDRAVEDAKTQVINALRKL